MSCLAVVLVVVNNSRPDLRDYKQECVRFWGPTLYFQVHGTAMGTRMAPSYAQLERRFLDNTNVKLLIWRRYIDVIFTIWCRGEASLECFLGDLNTTIKFKRSILFLDTGNGQLITDLHAKPTDTHQYLATISCHQHHCKEAIPFSQALQMCRICSTNDDFRKRSTELKSTSYIVAMNLLCPRQDRSSISHQERGCSHPKDPRA